ncbi:MAG: HDOD domain-containing protein [Synergistaceae bacterium]|nr:HDOD domain-containing protein [Synergistota bacterium]NLM70932.1 HDOD domain-containing protein [Synergistaceae bacterium]
MEGIDERTRELIKNRILGKIKEIRSFPQFVVETMRKLNDPDSSAQDVAASLSRDEGLVIRTLKLANSAAYGISRDISSITEAIALLGYKNISSIVLAASVYSVMDKPLAGYALDRGVLWRHSLSVAYSARYISQLTRRSLPEEAYVGGLLHDVGKVVLNDYVRFGYGIITKMVEEQQMPFLEAEVQVLGFDHALVGSMLVEKWGLPEAFKYAVAYHHAPNDLDEPEYQDLVDVVHLANSLCLMLGVGIGADGLQSYLFPESLERLGIEDYETLMSDLVDFVAQAEEELSEMEEAFR